MSNSIKLFLTVAVICSGMIMGLTILAQENQTEQEANLISTQDATQEITQDETVNPEDLDTKEPKILPGSRLYFIKEWSRGIQSFFAFGQIKKSELEQKFANERLMELKALVEKEGDSEILKKATEKYEKALEKIQARVEKIKKKAREDEGVNKFLDKFINQQILHEKILEKLENQVPADVIEKIKEARENHLERFKEVMLKLEDNKEKIAERLKNAIESQEGSEFKDFKNLEILNRIKEKMPEEVREQIQEKAEGKILERLNIKIEALPAEKQEVLKNYIDNISGDKEKQLEILENLKSEVKEENTAIKEKIQEIREKIIEKIPEQINVERIDCPKLVSPAPGFCEKGRIVPRRNEQGCVISFDCIIPAELENERTACITLWDPVCGKNEKTYSNACFAGLAGVEVAYKGECKEKVCQIDTDCPQPKCGPLGTISAKCINVQAKCVEGECKIISITP